MDIRVGDKNIGLKKLKDFWCAGGKVGQRVDWNKTLLIPKTATTAAANKTKQNKKILAGMCLMKEETMKPISDR